MIDPRSCQNTITRFSNHQLRKFLVLDLEESEYYLFDVWKTLPLQATVSRCLGHIGISRKTLTMVAAERSQLKRADHMIQLSEYIHKMLIHTNESAANEHSPWRRT